MIEINKCGNFNGEYPIQRLAGFFVGSTVRDVSYFSLIENISSFRAQMQNEAMTSTQNTFKRLRPTQINRQIMQRL